jgi:uncharacterized protein
MEEKKKDFNPIPFCSGHHGQTIMASLVRFEPWLRSVKHTFSLPDSDQLAMEITTPDGWDSSHPTVLLVHGLCGSHKSSNVVRLARKLHRQGLRSIRLNLRGCGSGKGLAKHYYHGGSSEDVLCAVKEIKKYAPNSPIILVGYSLGANIVLKLLGELGEDSKGLIEYGVSISPPADLKNSVHLMQQGCNQMYERYFIRLLIKDIEYRMKHFPELPRVDLSPWISVFEFDEYYIAPGIGYSSAFEYYENCSGKWFVPKIAVPCDILFARDDPIIDSNCLDDVAIPECVNIHKTNRGGHLGFLAHPREGFRWMDKMILNWIKAFLEPAE